MRGNTSRPCEEAVRFGWWTGQALVSKAENISKKAIRLANSIVNLFVLTVILLVFGFGCYAIWDSGQVASEASSERYASYKPSRENKGLSFQELQAINRDVFAWLTIYGTKIDYPVVQGKDNMQYLNTDAQGLHRISGAIYLDYRSSRDLSDFNSIIYGPHMDKRVMFGDIGLFSEAEFFAAHRYGRLYYDGMDHGIEFFAFVSCDGYDNQVFNPGIMGRESQQVYLKMMLDMATHLRPGVSVTTDDRLVLLATCSSIATNGRSVLIGRITDKVFEDPFKSENKNNNIFPGVDAITGFWSQASFGLKLLIVALLLLLVGLLIYRVDRRRRFGYQLHSFRRIQREEDG